MDSVESKCTEILAQMLKDMNIADPLYTPTDFWTIGVARIVDEINQKGLSSFRRHQSANAFFVPLYCRPYYRRHRELIDPLISWLDSLPFRKAGTDILKFLTGEVNAFSDYKTFRAADIMDVAPSLDKVTESEVGQPLEQFVFEARSYSMSFLNYLRGLVFLKQAVRPEVLTRTLEIGGGFGSLGEILLKADDRSVYVGVDIPPVAAVSTYYLKEVFGNKAVLGYDQTRDLEQIDLDNLPTGCRALILCPWQMLKLKGKVDLFANFISFQEMEPDVVRNYIGLVQRHRPEYVLLRNLREGKKKKTSLDEVGVNEPILLNDMIRWFEGYEAVARDTLLFGELKIDNFHSEIACLARNSHSAQ